MFLVSAERFMLDDTDESKNMLKVTGVEEHALKLCEGWREASAAPYRKKLTLEHSARPGTGRRYTTGCQTKKQ